MKSEDDLSRTVIYTPQIPTGVARTKGYGITRRVLVLRVGGTFRTLNSPHRVLADLGWIRTDYGLIRGRARRVLDRAEELLGLYTPGERTTVDEF